MVIPPKLWEVQVPREDWAILSFRCLLDGHPGATSYPVALLLLRHVWVRSLNHFGLETHLRIQVYKTLQGAARAPLCAGSIQCAPAHFRMLLFSVSLSKSFFLIPLFKKNCGRQLCGRCTWKASSLTGPEIALVILGNWYTNTPALLLLGWDNSEVHALPNFPLSLWG